MSENTPQQPGEPQQPGYQPPPGQPAQPAPPAQPYGQQPPAGPPPHGGQPPYGDQQYAQPQQPYEGQMPDPGLYPGSEYPPDRSAAPLMPGGQGSGFLSALFDYSFSRYITPSVVKVVYIIVTVLVVLVWLSGLVATFSQSVWGGVLYLVFGWIIALVYLALARIMLEFFLAVINVSEKVNAYAHRDGITTR
ncbi:DUF4282 domain-containing protein [Krasilnikoviella flava]|uniref:DUF4282 domain-containing protein n=1 Tax=Krasilnikoviella flava TaxID=526729 RepID=A0A1T5KWX2_9MICO|nr:DUF4282 domain-containing protein [Krasilnikoviella flava]SKC68284.1 protein of unknown function [Krasilnikoviella flava]